MAYHMPSPELQYSASPETSASTEDQPGPLDDLRSSLIGEWKDVLSNGFFSALGPVSQTPTPSEKPTPGDTPIVGRVLEGVDHIGEVAFRWIETLEDTLAGALRSSAQAPRKTQAGAIPSSSTGKSDRIAAKLQFPDHSCSMDSPASTSGSELSDRLQPVPEASPMHFLTPARAASPPLPESPSGSSTSCPSIRQYQSDLESLVIALQTQLSESQAKVEKLHGSCRSLARKCLKLKKENEQLRAADPMDTLLQSQLTALLEDKSRLSQENEALRRENGALHELLAYASYGSNQSDSGTCASPCNSQEAAAEFHPHLHHAHLLEEEYCAFTPVAIAPLHLPHDEPASPSAEEPRTPQPPYCTPAPDQALHGTSSVAEAVDREALLPLECDPAAMPGPLAVAATEGGGAVGPQESCTSTTACGTEADGAGDVDLCSSPAAAQQLAASLDVATD